MRADYSLHQSALGLGEFLIQQPFVVISAVLAVTALRRPLTALQAAWLVWIGCSLVVLLGHTPLRYHHVLLLLVPMACLGGEALWRWLRLAWPERRRLARYRILFLVVLLIALSAYGILLLRPFHLRPRGGEGADQLLRYAAEARVVATDQPFEAFQARLLMLPELVVFSKKRIDTNNLTSETVIEAIAARRPGQALFRKGHVDQTVLDFLEQDYVRVKGPGIHYVRRDAARQ